MAKTNDPDDHLDEDDITAALAYRLTNERAEHLSSCHVCQVTLEWSRMVKLGQLWEIEVDWYCKSMDALAESSRQKGNGMIYAMPSTGVYSRLARMDFEPPPMTIFKLK